MSKEQFTQEGIIEQVNVLYIDYLTGKDSLQPRNQRKTLRDKLISNIKIDESLFLEILKKAEPLKEKFIPYIDKMENIAPEAYFADDESIIQVIDSQLKFTQEFANQIGVDNARLRDRLYSMNEFYIKMISPASKVA